MGAEPQVQSLLLQINASTELLRQQLGTADATVAKFQQHTEEKLGLVDLAFDKVSEHAKEIGVGIAGFFAVESLVEMAEKGLEAAAALGEAAKQIGVTAEDLQVLRYAASQAGVATEDMDRGVQKFTRSLGEARTGSEKAAKLFRALGFTDEEIKHLDVHDALLKTADGIAQVGDRATRGVPEVQLFGRAGQQLDPLLSQGGKAIEAFAAQAEKLGLIIPDEFLERAATAEHQVSELKQVLSADLTSAVAQNTDAITGLAKAFEAVAIGALHAITNIRGSYTIIKNEGLLADLRATDAEAAEAGSDTGYRNRRMRQYQQARATFHADPSKANAAAYGTAIFNFREAQNRVNDDQAEAAAAAKLAQQGHGGNTLAGVNGPEGRKGPSAADAAKEAAAARQMEIERQKRVADEAARLDDQYLADQQGITADVYQRAAIERERLTTATAAQLAAVDSDVAAGRVKAAEAEGLKARINRNAAIEADAINQRENIQIEQDAFALANAKLDYLKDQLGSEATLATTAAARRAIALRLLAADKENERAQLQAIADDAVRPLRERHHSQEQIDAANAGLSTLDDRYAGKAEVAKQANASPGEAYLKSLTLGANGLNEAFQNVEVDGLKKLDDGLVGIIDGTKSIKSAFRDMATSIIDDLAHIAIEQEIIKPLASGLFGGGDIGGGSGSIGALLGFAAGGDPPVGVPSIVGEHGPELFVPKTAGTIIPNGALRAPTISSAALQGGGGGGVTNVTVHVHAEGAVLTSDVKNWIAGGMTAAAQQGAFGGRALANRDLGQAVRPRLPGSFG